MKFQFKKNQQQKLDKLFKEVSKEVKKRLKDDGYTITGFDDKELIKIWKIITINTSKNGDINIPNEVYCSNSQLKRFIKMNANIQSVICRSKSVSSSLKRRSTVARKSSSNSSNSSLKRRSTVARKSSLKRRSTGRKSSSSSSLERRSTIGRKSI